MLALLSFLVFLFYVIFNFLTNNGNGKRSFTADSDSSTPPDETLNETTGRVMEALDKFEDNFFN